MHVLRLWNLFPGPSVLAVVGLFILRAFAANAARILVTLTISDPSQYTGGLSDRPSIISNIKTAGNWRSRWAGCCIVIGKARKWREML